MTTCISGWAMLNRQTVVIPDIYLDDRIPHDAVPAHLRQEPGDDAGAPGGPRRRDRRPTGPGAHARARRGSEAAGHGPRHRLGARAAGCTTAWSTPTTAPSCQELDLKVKNTLAIVGAISRQALRAGPRPRRSPRCSSRILALSQAHELLTRRSWGRAELHGFWKKRWRRSVLIWPSASTSSARP
ncbi:HWE histidine kinase domain-containing protein [Caulobacter segnis]